MIETASWSHRILALAIDWVGSILVVMAFLGFDGWLDNPAAGMYTLGVFVLQSAFFIAIAGGSFGQIATRLRVVRYDGVPRPVDLIRALVRQVLIALVIPPLVFRPDGRGLHDMAVGSAVVRLRDLRGTPR